MAFVHNVNLNMILAMVFVEENMHVSTQSFNILTSYQKYFI